jgi:predicted HAD superfamily Cof-like phosphohydrolase
MVKAGQEVPDEPVIPDGKTRVLRAKLILEEAFETVKALGVKVRFSPDQGGSMWSDHWCEVDDLSRMSFSATDDADLEGIADGCADVIVVTTGTLIACGIKDEELQEEVDENNLRKFKHSCPECNSASSKEANDTGEPGVPAEAWRRCRGCGHTYRSGFRREDGKWVKPEGFKGPDVKGVIDRQRGKGHA